MLFLITLIIQSFFFCLCMLIDPSHQRAGGNLRYFEQMLFSELRDIDQTKKEPTEETTIQLVTYERPKDYLPERDIYEALCRGEGIKMVSTIKKEEPVKAVKIKF